MKLFAFTIEPLSGFGTPIKGDTLFGHFCWQASYDPALLEGGLDSCLRRYDQKPFAIFSSALVGLDDPQTPLAAPRPALPQHRLFSASKTRMETVLSAKRNKRRRWALIGRDMRIELSEDRLLSDEELFRKALGRSGIGNGGGPLRQSAARAHNTINRCTGATGKGMFAPYETDCLFYAPGTRLVVLVALDESVTDGERVGAAMGNIGKLGYGRDASTGLGRFAVVASEGIPWPDWASARALYTLGPSVLDPNAFAMVYCTPFVRFGRHGDRLAQGRNPFKNPVVMADEAAVCLLAKTLEDFAGYVGRPVTGISKALPETVTQGYSLCLPIDGPGLS